ncbi:MAG: hypothetical protein QOG76_5166 [Pseudonocardiales bacterium]|nr:hypothetical protein [Pseudonocardiales bacterium]
MQVVLPTGLGVTGLGVTGLVRLLRRVPRLPRTLRGLPVTRLPRVALPVTLVALPVTGLTTAARLAALARLTIVVALRVTRLTALVALPVTRLTTAARLAALARLTTVVALPVTRLTALVALPVTGLTGMIARPTPWITMTRLTVLVGPASVVVALPGLVPTPAVLAVATPVVLVLPTPVVPTVLLVPTPTVVPAVVAVAVLAVGPVGRLVLTVAVVRPRRVGHRPRATPRAVLAVFGMGPVIRAVVPFAELVADCLADDGVQFPFGNEYVGHADLSNFSIDATRTGVGHHRKLGGISGTPLWICWGLDLCRSAYRATRTAHKKRTAGANPNCWFGWLQFCHDSFCGHRAGLGSGPRRHAGWRAGPVRGATGGAGPPVGPTGGRRRRTG